MSIPAYAVAWRSARSESMPAASSCRIWVSRLAAALHQGVQEYRRDGDNQAENRGHQSG